MINCYQAWSHPRAFSLLLLLPRTLFSPEYECLTPHFIQVSIQMFSKKGSLVIPTKVVPPIPLSLMKPYSSSLDLLPPGLLEPFFHYHLPLTKSISSMQTGIFFFCFVHQWYFQHLELCLAHIHINKY